MAIKINLPKISDGFYQALAKKLETLPRNSHFWDVLCEVSEVVYFVDIIESIGHPEGAVSPFETTDPFLLVVEEEFRRLRKDGYSGGDFQLILLDAWLSVGMDVILAPCFTEKELNGG